MAVVIAFVIAIALIWPRLPDVSVSQPFLSPVSASDPPTVTGISVNGSLASASEASPYIITLSMIVDVTVDSKNFIGTFAFLSNLL
jgi:hypothetical protein